MNLETGNVGVIVFGDDNTIVEGDSLKRTSTFATTVMDVPIGEEFLGRVAGALGAPFDGQGPTSTKQPRRVELKAPSTTPRQSRHERQTGKTAIVFLHDSQSEACQPLA